MSQDDVTVAVPAPSTPPALTQYVWLMRILGVMYFLVGLSFFFFPNEVFYLINVGPKVFNFSLPMPDSVEHMWLVLATSMMMMLVALCFLAAESPRTRGYALVHILSKVISTAGFFYQYANHAHYFGYLVGIITDAPLAVIVTIAMIRVPRTPAFTASASSVAMPETGAVT